jgi:hypothetical protein
MVVMVVVFTRGGKLAIHHRPVVVPVYVGKYSLLEQKKVKIKHTE